MAGEKKWLKLRIGFESHDPEIMIAWLNMLDLEAMIEEEDFLEIYIKKDQRDKVFEFLNSRLQIDVDKIAVEELENKNWNELWESGFSPVTINDAIYIRAPFHDAPPERLQDVVIDPRMAFGTGHHHTTYLMLEWMETRDFSGRSVLDYGCGTGILSIYALKKACGRLKAIDIQEEAIENARDNFELNGMNPEGRIFQGELDKVSGEKFDIILANINRHVLIEKAHALKALLNVNGILVCSGILETDKDLLLSTYRAAGFSNLFLKQKGEWLLMTFNHG